MSPFCQRLPQTPSFTNTVNPVVILLFDAFEASPTPTQYGNSVPNPGVVVMTVTFDLYDT